MKVRETLKKYWQIIASTIVLLAALLTVVVRTQTVWNWLFPSYAGLNGAIMYDHEEASFFFPQSYTANEEKRAFITAAQGFIKINVQNISTIDVSDMRLTVPTDAVLEVVKKSGTKHDYVISDSFHLDSLAPNERYTLLVWLKRPFALNDQIAVTNQFGSVIFEPGFRIQLSELRFFQRGFYILLALSLLLGIVVFILVTLLRNKITPPEAPIRHSPAPPDLLD